MPILYTDFLCSVEIQEWDLVCDHIDVALVSWINLWLYILPVQLSWVRKRIWLILQLYTYQSEASIAFPNFCSLFSDFSKIGTVDWLIRSPPRYISQRGESSSTKCPSRVRMNDPRIPIKLTWLFIHDDDRFKRCWSQGTLKRETPGRNWWSNGKFSTKYVDSFQTVWSKNTQSQKLSFSFWNDNSSIHFTKMPTTFLTSFRSPFVSSYLHLPVIYNNCIKITSKAVVFQW